MTKTNLSIDDFIAQGWELYPNYSFFNGYKILLKDNERAYYNPKTNDVIFKYLKQ
jgi:hypothetical protein